MATATPTAPADPSKTANQGREQRKKTAVALAHTPDLSKFYGQTLPPISPGEYQFVLELLRPKLRPVLLTTVESLSWDDEQSALTGNMSVYRPDPADPASMPISKGDLVRCSVTWSENVYELWTMRCQPVQTEVDTANLSVDLQDDMALLDSGKQNWFFRKTKKRGHGYTADQITIEVCKTLGVGVGTMPKGTKDQAMTMRNASGLAVIRAAWSAEKAKTGTPYILRFRAGKLEVVTIRRNSLLYVLGPDIQTALITQKKGQQVPTTVLEGHGHIGKGKDAKKVSYTAYDRDVVNTLGYVHTEKDYGQVDSLSDLRDQVKLDYAAGIRVNDTISITQQGIPFILRGDGTQVKLPAEGYSGKNSYVYCTRASHNVQGGTYTTSWDFTLVDPFVAELNAEAKAAAAPSGTTTTLTGAGGATGTGVRWLVPASAEDDPPGAPGSCGPLPADGRGYSVLSASGTSGDAGTAGQALSVGSVWPCASPMIITNPANGRSVTAQHVDIGAGSDDILPVVGIYPQTRADLGLSGGAFHVIIQSASGQALAPARGTQV